MTHRRLDRYRGQGPATDQLSDVDFVTLPGTTDCFRHTIVNVTKFRCELSAHAVRHHEPLKK